MDAERPIIRCLVSFPIGSDDFTSPAVVSLELAHELHAKGYWVVGPDPHDMELLEAYERMQRWAYPRKWFEAP